MQRGGKIQYDSTYNNNNNTIENVFVRPDDIPENLIDLDKELPIYDNEFKIKIEFF